MNVIQSSLWAALVLAGTACASHPIQQRHVDAVPVQRSMAITAVDNVCAPVESTEVSEDLCGIDDNVVVRDPWERYNRRIHRFNGVIDRHVLRPLAVGYAKAVPNPIRSRVSRFFDNLDLPATAVNQTLQGQPLHALQSMGRFAVNTTVGIGGLFDPATRFKMPGNDDEDFGKTLATWGWRDSRYLVIPLLGPRNVRDALALVGDSALSPIGLVEDGTAATALQVLHVVDVRTRLLPADRARLEAYDEYALVRDAWSQRRRHQIDRDRQDRDD